MNRIEKQLFLYKKYMKVCRIENISKLCKEILNLENRLALLRNLNDKDLKSEVDFYYETKQSKLNKIGYE